MYKTILDGKITNRHRSVHPGNRESRKRGRPGQSDRAPPSARGVCFLASPEAKFAILPPPTAEEIERKDARVFTLRTMQARQLWLGGLPLTGPGDGVRIPGIPFAHFILRGFLRRRAGNLDVCLDNLARHADTVIRGINSWRRKIDRFVQRTIPDGAKPLSDPGNTGRFFLETQFPVLMKLATAIAHFDNVSPRSRPPRKAPRMSARGTQISATTASVPPDVEIIDAWATANPDPDTGLTPSCPTAIQRMIRAASRAATDRSPDPEDSPATRADLREAVSCILGRLDPDERPA